jgi:aspartyl/asparaginyl-tRNA synthetase
MMNDPVDKQQWEVRMAYKKGWEVRLAYYDSLLRSMLELLEGALRIMRVDELTEEMKSLGRAVVEIEDAYMALSLKATPSPLASKDGSKDGSRERDA